MEYTDLISENLRIHLEAYAEYLRNDGRICNVIRDEDGDWHLTVSVKGQDGAFAQFSLAEDPAEEGYLDVQGLYLSELLPGGKVDQWTIPEGSAPADVCEDVILPFVEDCFYEAYSNVTEIVGITDENLDEFVPFLDDRALTEENIRALGIYAVDGDDTDIIGAVSFGETEDSIFIENIALLPDYDDEDMEAYIVEYIKRNME